MTLRKGVLCGLTAEGDENNRFSGEPPPARHDAHRHLTSLALTDSPETDLLFSRCFECDTLLLHRIDDLFRRRVAAIGKSRGLRAHGL